MLKALDNVIFTKKESNFSLAARNSISRSLARFKFNINTEEMYTYENEPPLEIVIFLQGQGNV